MKANDKWWRRKQSHQAFEISLINNYSVRKDYKVLIGSKIKAIPKSRKHKNWSNHKTNMIRKETNIIAPKEWISLACKNLRIKEIKTIRCCP